MQIYKALVQRFFFVLPLVFSFSIASPTGTIIENTAKVSYTVDNEKQTSFSNSVKITKIEKKVHSQIEFYKYSPKSKTLLKVAQTIYPSYKTDSGKLAPIKPFKPSCCTKNKILNALPVVKCSQISVDEPIIIVLTNKNRNLDSSKVDSVFVQISNGLLDTEVLKLTESAYNSGMFIGYIYTVNDLQKKLKVDGDIFVHNGNEIRVTEILDYSKNRSLNQGTSRVFKISNPITLEEFDVLQTKKLWIKSSFNKNIVSTGEHIKCTISVDTKELNDIKIFMKLPKGFSYEKNSLQNNIIVTLTDNNLLQFTTKHKTEKIIEFSYLIKVGVYEKKRAIFSSWVQQNRKTISNISNNIVSIEKEIERNKTFIFGKVTNTDKKVINGVKLYLENGISTITDKNGKYHFEGISSGSHIVQVDIESLRANYKIKDSISQFVNLTNGGIKRVDFIISKKTRNEQKSTKKKKERKFIKKAERSPKMPSYASSDISKYKEKLKWIWPPKKYNPSIPSIKVAILHNKKDKLELFLNAKPVNLLNYDGKITNPKKQSVISVYRGIDIINGNNILEAKITSPNGKIKKILKRKVHLSTAPTIAKIIEDKSFLVADGKNSPVIAVQLLDNQGYPLRDDIQGTFTIEFPYLVQSDKKELNQNPISKTKKSKYIVYGNGITYIKLQPTTKSGEVKLDFNLQNRTKPLRAWLKPSPRDWLIVGFTEGTVGYKTINKNMKNSKDIHKLYRDGRVSLFAKGKIKGDFLLTMAYDSGKEKDLDLFEQIDPNENYTIYQDNSRQMYEAQSKRRVYLKIEKEKFYMLFGDIKSDLSISELSKYNRTFNGIKSEYKSEKYEYTAFVSDTKNIFSKDEIKGDGTSGIYHLKNRAIVANSEMITIEVRDRYKNEKIIDEIVLNRYSDYSIDYNKGEIYFKEPIYSIDIEGNPRFIIVDYEIEGDGKSKYTYGGRGAIKFNNKKIEISSTYIKEDNGEKSTELIGTDTTVKIGKNIKLKGEYAKTMTKIKGRGINGDAFLVEAKYHNKIIQATAYIRQEKDAFGLNQQKQNTRHNRKSGIEATLNYWQYVAVKFLALQNKDLLTDSQKSEVELISQYKRKQFTTLIGFRFGKQNSKTSTQLVTGFTKNIFNNKASLKLNYDRSLQNRTDQYPTRAIVTLGYSINSYIDLFLMNQRSNGDLTKLNESRLGIKSKLWKNSQLTSDISTETKNGTQKLYNNLGINQKWQINNRVSVNGGIDKKKSIKGDKSDDFTAYSASVSYNNAGYFYNAKTEYHDAQKDDKININLGVYTEVKKDLGVALGIRSHSIRNSQDLQKELQANFSFAYRPEQKWIVLNRFDFIHSDKSKDTTDKFINNLLLNYKLLDNFELSLQYGLKYIKEKIDKQTFDTVVDLLGVDIIYKIKAKYELGLHASALHSYQSKQIDYALGMHTGYNATKNSWVALGYNLQGFEDSDFSSQNSRSYGPYIQIRIKFDQLSLKETLNQI